jgi:hypothetical protein
MTTYDYTLRLDDCEIIALENLLKYVLDSYSDDEQTRKSAVMAGVNKLPCENMLKKIKDSWKTASMMSTSSACMNEPIILPFNGNKP